MPITRSQSKGVLEQSSAEVFAAGDKALTAKKKKVTKVAAPTKKGEFNVKKMLRRQRAFLRKKHSSDAKKTAKARAIKIKDDTASKRVARDGEKLTEAKQDRDEAARALRKGAKDRSESKTEKLLQKKADASEKVTALQDALNQTRKAATDQNREAAKRARKTDKTERDAFKAAISDKRAAARKAAQDVNSVSLETVKNNLKALREAKNSSDETAIAQANTNLDAARKTAKQAAKTLKADLAALKKEENEEMKVHHAVREAAQKNRAAATKAAYMQSVEKLEEDAAFCQDNNVSGKERVQRDAARKRQIKAVGKRAVIPDLQKKLRYKQLELDTLKSELKSGSLDGDMKRQDAMLSEKKLQKDVSKLRNRISELNKLPEKTYDGAYAADINTDSNTVDHLKMCGARAPHVYNAEGQRLKFDQCSNAEKIALRKFEQKQLQVVAEGKCNVYTNRRNVTFIVSDKKHIVKKGTRYVDSATQTQSGWSIFSVKTRKEESVKNLKFGEQGAAISKRWHAMTDAKKKPYEHEADKANAKLPKHERVPQTITWQNEFKKYYAAEHKCSSVDSKCTAALSKLTPAEIQQYVTIAQKYYDRIVKVHPRYAIYHPTSPQDRAQNKHVATKSQKTAGGSAFDSESDYGSDSESEFDSESESEGEFDGESEDESESESDSDE
jgi:hypothetical protein